MIKTRAGALWVAAVVLAVGTGCAAVDDHPKQSSPSTTTIAVPPPKVRFAYQWAQMTVDPSTPEATFTRAIMESSDLMKTTGKSSAAYPGFWDAVGKLFFQRDSEPHLPEAGQSIRMGIARLEKVQPTLSRAWVCDWGTASNWEQRTPIMWVLDFQTDGTPAPPAQQSGPEKRPAANIFGGWKLTYYNMLNDSPELDPALADECRNYPVPSAADPATPSPGWPTSK
ncbi:hypothetical protein ACFXHA_29055 [Nocardia sp. NPDC059240]|uniref:hypothetical protein n=1 Tax=Nocardia sp. NPDC059240 TaxID=3346786 RepID=UPI0036A0BAB9